MAPTWGVAFIAGSAAEAGAKPSTNGSKKAVERRWRGSAGAKGNLGGTRADISNCKHRLIPYVQKNMMPVGWVKYFDKAGSQLRKAEVVQSLTELFQRNDVDKKTVYYTGHGTPYEGNWCFEDGEGGEEFITFEELMDLFQTHNRNGAHLCLVLDCCFSGVWVNKAQERRTEAHVWASCRGDEISSEDDFGGYFLKEWIDCILKGESQRQMSLFKKEYRQQHPQAWYNGKRMGV